MKSADLCSSFTKLICWCKFVFKKKKKGFLKSNSYSCRSPQCSYCSADGSWSAVLCPGLPDGQLLRTMGELIHQKCRRFYVFKLHMCSISTHFLKETAGTAELTL